MFQTLKNAWKIPELKNKILFTLMIIVLYRLGSSIPMPWISPDLMEGGFMSNGALGWLNLLYYTRGLQHTGIYSVMIQKVRWGC